MTKSSLHDLCLLVSKLKDHNLFICGGAFLSIAAESKIKDIDLTSFSEPKNFLCDYTLKYKWKNGYSGWIGKDGLFHLQYLGINSHLKFDITSSQGIILPDLTISYCPKPQIIEYNVVYKETSNRRLKKYISRWENIEKKVGKIDDLTGASLYDLC